MKSLLGTVVVGVLMLCGTTMAMAEGEVEVHAEVNCYAVSSTAGMGGDLDGSMWVAQDGEDDDQFGVSARPSRIVLDLKGLAEGTGRIELDFFGGLASTGEDRPLPQLRKGYFRLDFPDTTGKPALLVGLDDDLLAPIDPDMVYYSSGWSAGNVGYRRAQLRGELTFGGFKTQLAIAQPPSAAGQASGIPDFQGRLAIAFPMGGDRATIGLSGAYGRQDDTASVETTAAALDFTLPFHTSVLDTPVIALSGEVFYGQCIDSYMGGIGQGRSSGGLGQAIRSVGGWVQLSLGLGENGRLNLGYMVDRPAREDFDATDLDFRSGNSCVFLNCGLKFGESSKIEAEVLWWVTEFSQLTAGGDDEARALMFVVGLSHEF